MMHNLGAKEKIEQLASWLLKLCICMKSLPIQC